VVPDMSGLTDGEVRQWGRAASDCKAEVDIDGETGQVDLNWVTDAIRWSSEVLEAVAGGSEIAMTNYERMRLT